MRRNFPTIFVILMLIILIWCSACVSQSSSDKIPQQKEGLTEVVKPVEPQRMNFEMIKAELIAYRLDLINDPITAKTVNYMRSRDVDESGNANGWIFGVYNGSEAEFLVYDQTGWTTIRNATLPSDTIVLDTIVSPDFLFKQNKELISGNPSPAIPERRDLELQRGVYKLTITSGNNSRVLKFNATTGALIT
jgi:hypothetical protein